MYVYCIGSSAFKHVCLMYGVVPSLWQHSIVAPVPKKPGNGISNPDDFRGITLISVVAKVLCTMINGRLSRVMEQEGLLVEEQGGFRKHKGCRDQVLLLVLIAQNQISKSKDDMLTAFIDFRKVYDTVVREKLWECLEELGMKGRCLCFVKALYIDNSSQARIGESLGGTF